MGEDYPERILDDLAERGVDLEGVRREPGPSLRTWLLYEGRRRRVVHRLDGPTHAQVSPGPGDLPPSWRPRACHLAPMPFPVQSALVSALAGREGLLLSLDPYELVRDGELASWHDLLAGVDLLFLSEDEMEMTDGLDEPEMALRRLAGPAPRLRRIFYKRGAGGGLVLDPADGAFEPWRPLAHKVVEPTGAGDAFAGGVLAGHLLGDTPRAALARGLVSASFALEGHGPQALLLANPDEAATRLA